MLKEYVTQLLYSQFPEPMHLSSQLIENFTLPVFLEDSRIQQKLLQSWKQYQMHLLQPDDISRLTSWADAFSHRWYLFKFIRTLAKTVESNRLQQLAQIHSMLIDITPRQQAQLKLCLQDYPAYIRWQQRFVANQYYISFQPLEPIMTE